MLSFNTKIVYIVYPGANKHLEKELKFGVFIL